MNLILIFGSVLEPVVLPMDYAHLVALSTVREATEYLDAGDLARLAMSSAAGANLALSPSLAPLWERLAKAQCEVPPFPTPLLRDSTREVTAARWRFILRMVTATQREARVSASPRGGGSVFARAVASLQRQISAPALDVAVPPLTPLLSGGSAHYLLPRASSTDDPGREDVANVLLPEISTRRFGRAWTTTGVYWSSVGSSDETSSEFLYFALPHSSAVVLESVGIAAFKADFQRNEIYAPQGIRLCVQRASREHTDVARGEHELGIALSRRASPHPPLPWVALHEGVVVSFDDSDALQMITLTPPVLLDVNDEREEVRLRIELLGRRQRQVEDNLYYTCISRVVANGRVAV